ncbi:MAG: invasion associated locus B family protein [Paracoccaceae bacterium]
MTAISRIFHVFAAMAAICVAVTPAAVAQTQTRVDASRDWSVFEATQNGTKVCWIVSMPTKSVALRGGNQVEVRRGDIFLMVANRVSESRPGENATNEVNFVAGYPFKAGSEVEVTVGSESFTMFTDGENAWTPSPSEDQKLVSAFRRGVNARVEGVSSRGTTTVDTFSLLGFTAALESATGRCG